MAFGEKQRRIEQLEGENRHLQGELDAIQPWLGLAQTIRTTAAEHAATMDLDTAIGLAVHDTAEEQRQLLVMTAFNRLGPEQQLEMLVSTFGDGVLKEALEEERQRRLSLSDSDLAFKLLIREAREHRRFRPSSLPEDAKVELFFYKQGALDPYNGELLKRKDPRSDRSENWERRIRGVAVGDGSIVVHDDSLPHAAFDRSRYQFADHQTITFSTPHDGPLYYNVNTRIPKPKDDGYYKSMDLDLGPVFVNDVDIFGVVEPAEPGADN